VFYIFLFCLILACARTTSANRSTLYAEDGAFFLQDWLNQPSVLLPFMPYDGYLHVVPRVATGLVSMLPVGLWPVGCVFLASVCLASVGALVWKSLESVGLPTWSRLLLAGIPLCSPVPSVEPIGNLANAHWFFAYLIVFVALIRVENLRSGIAWGAVALICALTEVQCALVLPVMAYRLVRHRSFRPVAIGWGIGMATQTVATLLAPRANSTGAFPDGMVLVRGYLIDVVAGSVTSRQEVISAFVEDHGFVPLAVGLTVYVAVCLALATVSRRPWRWQVPHFLFLSLAAWMLASAFGAGNSSYTFTRETPYLLRWGTTASLYLLAAGALALGLAAQRWPRLDKVGLVVIVVASVIWIPSFRSQLTLNDTVWASEVAEAQQECAANVSGVPTLDTAPSGWSVEVPCARLRR